MLDGVLGEQTGVVGRTAGDDVHLVQVAEVIVGETVLVEVNPAVDEVPGEGVTHGGGLLVDLLDHEGVVAALLRGGEVPVDGERAALGGAAVEVEELVAVRVDHDDGVLAEFHGVAGEFDEGGDV